MLYKFKLIFIIFLLFFSKANCTEYKNNNNEIISQETNVDEYDDFEDYGFDEYEEDQNEIKIKDPLEKLNRKIFSFNIFMLENVAAPLINVYNSITNQFIRDRINNFGDRFFDPTTLINSVLQLDYKNSLKTISTFSINMTVGILGLFNPAEKLGLYRERRTVGQVLASYGIGKGMYIMMPFLGPMTLRDGIGSAIGLAIDPFSFNLLGFDGDIGDLTPNELIAPKYIGGYDIKVEGAIKLNKDFLQKSFDPYIFTRDSYIQNLEYKNNKKGNNNEK